MLSLIFIVAVTMLVVGLIGGYLIWGEKTNRAPKDTVQKVVDAAVVNGSGPATLHGAFIRRGLSAYQNRKPAAHSKHTTENTPGDHR